MPMITDPFRIIEHLKHEGPSILIGFKGCEMLIHPFPQFRHQRPGLEGMLGSGGELIGGFEA